jgi:[NiFe] hydrogenase diaphorase moiety large subunit
MDSSLPPAAIGTAATAAARPALSAPQGQALATVLRAQSAAPHGLLQILRTLQAHPAFEGWLPPALLARVAEATGLSLAAVRGVASGYRFLHLKPAGRYRILFSDNVTDRHAGSRRLMADLCARLGVRPGAVRDDGLVSVDTASCIGLGDQGPALLVNHAQVVTRLDAARIAAIAERVEAGVPPAAWPAHWSRVDDVVHRAGPLLGGTPAAPGEALMRALALGPAGVIDEVRASGLRGRGGAGFRTALKWTLCREAAGDDRVVVCNADEGEPGTFKDRALLARHADEVVEGMTLAAWAIGARQGFIYLRGEYPFLVPHLEAVLARRRAQGWLGRGIAGRAGFDFDIRLHVGAGAYVCGEESALRESLEGRRGTPRIRPPFPVTHGYRGLPTVVNNVETLCAVTHIVARGAAAWAAMGTPESTGSKIHSVSGDCERPGLYEYPFGTPLARILADCGAKDTQAVQVGGPSGTCLAANGFQRRIAFEDVPTAGALMVFDHSRDMFEVARGFSQFFAHESCGFCTPCRVGTELVVRRMDKLAGGRGSRQDLEELLELDGLMHAATHCGLGYSACHPLRDTVRLFPQAYERRLLSPHFGPAFDLDAELAATRGLSGRDDPGAHLEP